MPRSSLVWITAAVLAAHGLVLGGLSLGGAASDHAPAVRVFSTRSIAPAPPATAPSPPPTALAPAAAATRPAPVALPARPPAPSAGTATQTTHAPAPAPEENAAAEALDSAPVLPDAPMSEAPDSPSPDTGAAEAPEAPPWQAPLESLPSTATLEPAAVPHDPASKAPPPADAVAQPAPPPPATGQGVDIIPPAGAEGAGGPSAPAGVKIPPSTRLAFDVSGQAKKLHYTARAQLLWQHNDGRYTAHQEISAFLIGSRRQSSTGEITAQGLQPERFSDRARSEQAAHFDYAQGRVTFSANTPDAPAAPGVQDRLSVFIQLGALLAADPGRFVPGTAITLTTVSARAADRWTFTVEGPETLELPAGSTPTLKLQRLPRKTYDQTAELWVAPALGYLPVRIKLTQANGDFADLLLRSSAAP